MGSTKI